MQLWFYVGDEQQREVLDTHMWAACWGEAGGAGWWVLHAMVVDNCLITEVCWGVQARSAAQWMVEAKLAMHEAVQCMLATGHALWVAEPVPALACALC